MPKIEFSAIGEKPVAWGNNEWDWRRAVADEARKHRSEANASEVTAQTRFTGALFDVDDEQVYKLGLEKTNVSLAAEEGAEITIVW
jgi:hypothetical protein